MENRGLKGYIRDLSIKTLAQILGGVGIAILTAIWASRTKALQPIGQAISTAWEFLLSPVSLPLLALGVLVAISAYATVSALNSYFVGKRGPTLNEYRTDFIYGLIWQWDRIAYKMPDISLWCYCPTCFTRLTPHLQKRSITGTPYPYTEFFCETHSMVVEVIPGQVDDILPRVSRQVEKKINTGEWKDVVRRSKAGTLIPKVERPSIE